MELLLCHLVGDYVLQSHKMAYLKTQDFRWAFIHGCFYGRPFLVLSPSFNALLVLVSTHILIDHFKLADKWCRFYGVGHPGLWMKPGDAFTYPPPAIGLWLTIIVDNTFHLLINYMAFRTWPG